MTQEMAGGKVRDLTPGMRDVSAILAGWLGRLRDLACVRRGGVCENADRDLATSTNSDIYVVPIGGGESKKISTSPGADSGPVYSPDGAYIAFRSQARAGYESDRWRLALYDRSAGKVSFLNDSLDRNVNSVFWTPDAKRVFFVSEDRGRHSLQMIPVQGGGAKTIIGGAVSIDDLQFSSDGKTLVYTQQSGSRPMEIYRVSSSGGAAVP